VKAARELAILHPGVSVVRICQVLGVSRASYYRPVILKAWDVLLIEAIERIVTTFWGYGYRRVTLQLRLEGWSVGKKTVRKAMKEHSLLCHLKRKWTKTTDSEHGLQRHPNLAKGFVANGVNQLWVADLTYIHTGAGFVYLAAILDAHSRKVVAWHVSRSLSAELALTALAKALAARNPAPGWIHHSDQGVQYACRGYAQMIAQGGGVPSMSAKGRPRDNAKAESFFATLKREEVRFQSYDRLADVDSSMEHFIDDIYNPRRLHSALGYQSPNDFEQKEQAEPLKT